MSIRRGARSHAPELQSTRKCSTPSCEVVSAIVVLLGSSKPGDTLQITLLRARPARIRFACSLRADYCARMNTLAVSLKRHIVPGGPPVEQRGIALEVE